jgi:hypothetical protein
VRPSDRWVAEAGLIEKARALWDTGLSTRQIALKVGHGCSKSAIVGYSHRHGWPARLSPIRPKPATAAALPPALRRKLVPSEARSCKTCSKSFTWRSGRGKGLFCSTDCFAAWRQAPATPPPVQVAPSPPQPRPRRAAPVIVLHPPPFRRCQFLGGDGRPWLFCDAAAVRRSPYCEEHFDRCYLPKKREERAA